MLSDSEKNNRVCKAEGCDRKVYAKGCCNKHYNQLRTYGELRPDLERAEYSSGASECSEYGCHAKVVAKGLCNTHYQQVRRAAAQADQIEANMEPIPIPKPAPKRRRAVRRRA